MVLYRKMAQGYKFIQKERPPYARPLLRIRVMLEGEWVAKM